MRLRISILAALILLPFTGVAASATLQIPEMVAGVGGEAVIEGLSPNASGTLKIQTPSSRSFLLSFTINQQGSATVRILGTQVQEAGMYTATLTVGGSQLSSASFTVLADKLDAKRSTVTTSSSRITPDGRDSVTVTVSLMDRYGNGLSGRPVELISSRSEDQVRASTSTTDDAGAITFTVKTTKAGAVTLSAFDLLSALTLDEKVTINAGSSALPAGAEIGAYPSYAAPYPQYMPPYYQPYPQYMPPYGYDPYSSMNASLFGNFAAQAQSSEIVDRFQIEVNPAQPKTNDAASFTVSALDRNGKVVPNYFGTISIFSPTDPTAVVPGAGLGMNGRGTYTFLPRDQGVKQFAFGLVFHKRSATGEKQVLRVEDTSGSAVIFGEWQGEVTGSDVIPDGNRITVTYPVKNGFVNSTRFVLKGTGPRFANLTVTVLGGEQDKYTGESDGDGKFEIPITLAGQAANYLLRIQSQDGRYDSGDIPFGLDALPPEVKSVTFLPEKPQEGDSVLVSVESEANAVVKLTVEKQEYTLTPDATKPGTNRAAVQAPKAGTYQLIVVVTDSAGNMTQQRVALKVAPPGLAIVTGLKGEITANRVKLTWYPVEGADHYNVYVGKEPQNLLAIPTPIANPAPTEVVISDLEAGTQYFFAVTALNSKDGSESVDKSEFVTMRPLGLKMTVTPETDALRIKWIYPNDVPLAAFVLEYGVDRLSERRLLNGESRESVVRDLLAGVTYQVRLTPVAITGEPVADQSAQGEGTVPSAVGFRPTPGEAVSGTIPSGNEIAPPDELHTGAPSTPGSGLPEMALLLTFGIAAAGALLLVFSRRQMSRQGSAFLATMEQRYRGS